MFHETDVIPSEEKIGEQEFWKRSFLAAMEQLGFTPDAAAQAADDALRTARRRCDPDYDHINLPEDM